MWKWIIGCLLCSSAWTQTIQSENELLWEISGNGLKKKSFLFGSLHSNDKRLFRFSDSTYVALEKAEAIVLETDIFSLFEDWDTRKEELTILYDSNGNPYTASNKATKTIYGNEDGMPQFLDAYFLQYCYNAGKKFFALETVDKQLDLASEWIQPDLGAVGQNLFNPMQEKMIDLYLKGDIYSLDRMMRVTLSYSPGMYEDFIVDRNIQMVIGLDSLIKKQSLFCAVGAGHLAGENGLINLLRKKGYKVRKVSATFSEELFAEKSDVKSKKTYTYINDTIGINAEFPGKPMELKIWDNHPYLIYREMGQGNTYSMEIVPIEDETSLEEHAAIYIASPDASKVKHLYLDNGSEIYEGLSDTYSEGIHWVRVIQNDKYLLILKAYGGNKFMHSNRPNVFFSKIWFE